MENTVLNTLTSSLSSLVSSQHSQQSESEQYCGEGRETRSSADFPNCGMCCKHLSLNETQSSGRHSYLPNEILSTQSSTAQAAPHLRCLGILGCSKRGVVYEVEVTGFDGTMACKTFQLKHPIKEDKSAFQDRLERMGVYHPHVAKIVTSHQTGQSMTILMYPAANFNLSQYLQAYSCRLPAPTKPHTWLSC